MMTDQEHANKIAGLERQLNQAIYDAAVTGLTIRADVLEINRITNAMPVPCVSLTIARIIDPA